MIIRNRNKGAPKAHEYKRPMGSTTRYIGVEIECFTLFPQQQLQGAFALADLDDKVCVGTDSSLNWSGKETYRFEAHEVRLLTSVEHYTTDIARACEVLDACGSRVNRTCGLHVHLDQRYARGGGKLAYRRLVRALPLLFAICAKSRRQGDFCRMNKSDDLPYTLANLRAEDHRTAVNAFAMNKHQTLEVRLHHGTANAKKISGWIDLLLAIEHAPASRKQVSTLADAADVLRLDLSQRTFIQERLERHNNGRFPDPCFFFPPKKPDNIGVEDMDDD